MSNNFIICDPDAIVRMDIEGLLLAHLVDAVVTVGASLADVATAIIGCGTDTVLFVRGSMMTDNNDLHRVVRDAAARGCLIVIVGECAKRDFPANVIEPPFTTDMVISALVRDQSEDGQDLIA